MTPVEPTPRGESQEAPLTAKAVPSKPLYELALDAARDWREDAHLIWIEQTLSPERQAVFAFDAASDPEAGLLVYLAVVDNSLKRATQDVVAEGRSEVRPAIADDDWLIDSDEAFEIAMSNGGGEFALNHPEATTDWFLQLRYRPGLPLGDLAWRMHIGRLYGETFEAFIDPMTGEVLEVEIDSKSR